MTGYDWGIVFMVVVLVGVLLMGVAMNKKH